MEAIVSQIGALLIKKEATLATAESCTGGLIGHLLTNVAGSSQWYIGGAISYSNELKQQLLAVNADTIEDVGAVSAEVAEQMARGAQQAFGTEYAISVTGIAGPSGGTAEKPVGLTYIGIATPQEVSVQRFVWDGDRHVNKQQSAKQALIMLLEKLGADSEVSKSASPRRSAIGEGGSAKVEIVFQPDGRMRPVSFAWQGRTLKVTSWGRQWEKEGVRHFLVMTTGDRVWELRFVSANGYWSIHSRSAPYRTV